MNLKTLTLGKALPEVRVHQMTHHCTKIRPLPQVRPYQSGKAPYQSLTKPLPRIRPYQSGKAPLPHVRTLTCLPTSA